MLEVRGVSAGYGRHAVLDGVSLEVAEGELVVVLGSNGAGKTTLIGVLSGMLAPGAGTIRFRGEAIGNMPPHRRARLGIATVPQGRGLFADMSVADNLALGAFARPDGAAGAERLADVFALFPRLRERRAQAAETMSGGEQQMVALGRALMSGPALLLLDEPSLGLSPALTTEVFRAIRRIADRGVGIMLVEQNARQSLKIADRAYLIEAGRIVGAGPAAEIAADGRVLRAYLGG
ncbi:ABC transporter ATP-binding protein [Propylenella binzhouense]|uniref:ABC transporter ATP-binding protein n=1 Tax=Propylenella binzhouense TaxID=2555902 RepID=A0A964T3H6_9HYPH|nr:ABC transporter ATP-binding protein [Propylenella binzhouense]MYZ47783.1 ABC transporter ATP-binding protein [Propylenella binzhouense]